VPSPLSSPLRRPQLGFDFELKIAAVRGFFGLFGLVFGLGCSEPAAPGATAAGGHSGSGPVSGGNGGVPGSAGGSAAGGGAAGVMTEAGAPAAGSGAGGADGSIREIWIPGKHGCPEPATFGEPLSHAPVAAQIHDGTFGFLEGPLWFAPEATLLYTNFEGSGSNGRIRSYRPNDRAQGILIEGVGVNGLAFDAAGLLVAAYHQEQQLLRIDPLTKEQLTVAGSAEYQGAPLNAPNDVVARSDGQLYFTDPTYQRGDRPGQPVAGTYHLTSGGILTLIDTQDAPNGIALSPDGRTLYVAGTGNPHPFMKYEVLEDGNVVVPGAPISDVVSDGMTVDCAGNLYLTTGGGSDGVVTVLSPDGAPLGSIAVDATSGTTSVGFGGPDYTMLFVTTSTGGLFEIPMVVPGLP
jgi:gluconolactonase